MSLTRPNHSNSREIQELELLCALDRARLRLIAQRRSLRSRAAPHVIATALRAGGLIPGPLGRLFRRIHMLDTVVGPLLRGIRGRT